jgi:hypothetical protein
VEKSAARGGGLPVVVGALPGDRTVLVLTAVEPVAALDFSTEVVRAVVRVHIGGVAEFLHRIGPPQLVVVLHRPSSTRSVQMQGTPRRPNRPVEAAEQTPCTCISLM